MQGTRREDSGKGETKKREDTKAREREKRKLRLTRSNFL